jgi:cation diffusion facilitator family transporter
LNGVLLLAVGGGLLWESIDRLRHPSPVLALPLLWIAALGMLLNIVSALLLARAMAGGHSHHGHGHAHGPDHAHHGHEHGLPAATPDRNLQGAYLHVLSDALGSLAVVVGAAVTYYTDWLWVDPALAAVLSLLILRWSLRLLLDSGHVLLEGVPRHIQAEKVLADLKAVDERVAEVADLHIWEITSRMYAATAEVKVGAMSLEEAESLRARMDALLRQKFGIAHSVLALKP